MDKQHMDLNEVWSKRKAMRVEMASLRARIDACDRMIEHLTAANKVATTAYAEVIKQMREIPNGHTDEVLQGRETRLNADSVQLSAMIGRLHEERAPLVERFHQLDLESNDIWTSAVNSIYGPGVALTFDATGDKCQVANDNWFLP